MAGRAAPAYARVRKPAFGLHAARFGSRARRPPRAPVAKLNDARRTRSRAVRRLVGHQTDRVGAHQGLRLKRPAPWSRTVPHRSRSSSLGLGSRCSSRATFLGIERRRWQAREFRRDGASRAEGFAPAGSPSIRLRVPGGPKRLLRGGRPKRLLRGGGSATPTACLDATGWRGFGRWGRAPPDVPAGRRPSPQPPRAATGAWWIVLTR
jgi:hypothetical protein